MDTPMGFRTDRDPKRAKKGEEIRPYSVEVVRDCFIQSRLHGLRVIGNEWNLIANNFYAAKNGFRRRLTDGKTFPTLSNLKDSYDAPRLQGDKGAIVKCKASWLLNGQADSIECEIPVVNNAFMGVDALIGKAERKLLKRVHDRISGTNTPEGEAGDEGAINVGATVVPEVKKPLFTPPPAPGDDELPMGGPTPMKSANAEPPAAPAGPIVTAEHIELELFLDENAISFDRLHRWAVEMNWEPGFESYGSLAELPAKSVQRLLKSKAGLLKQLTTVAPK
jgi:hypothetical protein